MKKFFCILLCLFAIPRLSQNATDENTEPEVSDDIYNDQIYREITLEDFEAENWDSKNVSMDILKDEKADLQSRTNFPAPITNAGKKSQKYIGIKVYGKSGNVVTIKPKKVLSISQHCKSISAWVYGKNFSGELSMMIQDGNGNTSRVIFPEKLNFLGWKKLTAKLGKNIIQEDKFLSKTKKITILYFMYKPASITRLPQWNYFYMDDISAQVREKYLDKQDDNW